jgi:hypothetical protein
VHTDIPTHGDLERLLSARGGPCVSIYLPTTPEERGERDRLEFRRLSEEALERLAEAPLERGALNDLRDVLDDLADDEAFWARQAHSLAVFATPAGAQAFQVANRLSPMALVGDRFHVKPLLRSATFPQAAFVLALSQNAVRVVEVSPDAPPTELDVPGMPTDAASAVGKASLGDRSPIRRIQGADGQKLRLRQYARRVEEALRPTLAGLDLPLIIAAAEPLDSIFRSVTTYPHLAPVGIPGNPDAKSDASVPGSVDEDDGAVSLAEVDVAGNYGVVDEIARRVLLARGRVLAVRREDVPGGGPVAAISSLVCPSAIGLSTSSSRGVSGSDGISSPRAARSR